MIQLIAAFMASPLAEATFTVPSSAMSILAPVFSTISRMTLPPVPITSRILSTAMLNTSMRGACSPSSVAVLGQRLRHVTQDVQPAVAWPARGQCCMISSGDAGDLDVHLQRGHAPLGAGHLEVHVAEMVLVAEDVGEHGIALVLEDEAHGDTRRSDA